MYLTKQNYRITSIITKLYLICRSLYKLYFKQTIKKKSNHQFIRGTTDRNQNHNKHRAGENENVPQ